MVSDKQYAAAEALDEWCDNRISEGLYAMEDLSLDEELQYHTLAYNYDILTNETSESMIINRMTYIVEIIKEKIIRDHCA